MTSQMSSEPQKRNDSELLFEEYLRAHELNQWDYETEIEGKRKRPDYRLEFQGDFVFFDVKEFHRKSNESPRGPIAYDPYPPVREKINAAREKFKEYKEFCCSLVLRNINDWRVHLSDPKIVMGAMLGDFGLRLPLDPELGMVVGEAVWTFLERGKMIDVKHMQPQNTTISALIVLNRFPLGQRRLRMEWARKEKELGRKLSFEEFFRFAEVLRTKGMDAGDTIPRVVVHENPYARMPLTREIFIGPFDERFGPEGDHMMRVFAGTEIEKLEAGENALK